MMGKKKKTRLWVTYNRLYGAKKKLNFKLSDVGENLNVNACMPSA